MLWRSLPYVHVWLLKFRASVMQTNVHGRMETLKCRVASLLSVRKPHLLTCSTGDSISERFPRLVRMSGSSRAGVAGFINPASSAPSGGLALHALLGRFRIAARRSTMVERLQYRRRHCYATRSNKVRKVKTPGERALQYHFSADKPQTSVGLAVRGSARSKMCPN